MTANENQIVVYQPNETVRLDVRLENETVWLSQEQISNLFGTKRPAISERLSLELPGLRGFSPTNIKNMRIFFEQWADGANRQLPTDDLGGIVSVETLPVIRQLSTGELTESDIAAFFSIGFTHHMEIIFTYRTSADVPPAYKALKPLLDGSQKLLTEMKYEDSVSPRKTKKGKQK